MSKFARTQSLPNSQPRGPHACLGLGDSGDTLTSRLDRNGFGYYQILLIIGLGVFSLSQSMELGAVAPLHTGLARSFKMTVSERTSMVGCIYMGGMFGLVVAGPLGDLFGRRGTLVFGIVCRVAFALILANLPSWAPVWLILWLRAACGFAGSIGGPAGIALAVESCSSESRVTIMFAVSFFGALGYMCESVGVALFMPEFGEGEHDSWQGLTLFAAAAAAVSLPFVFMLRESPSFLLITGRNSECAEALKYMAWCNGKQRPDYANDMLVHSQTNDRAGQQTTWGAKDMTETTRRGLLESLAGICRSYLPLMLLLLLIESSKAFFISGSAYLCKDLFMRAGSLKEASLIHRPIDTARSFSDLVLTAEEMQYGTPSNSGSSMNPSSMNILASATPLFGIICGYRLAAFGVRQVTFVFCVIAFSSFMLLTPPTMRASSNTILTCVLLFKLTYGPINSCVNLMLVEAFPAEVRATAYSIVNMAGNLLSMLGPVLVERLRGSARAETWEDGQLAIYLIALAMGSFVCGLLALFVPPKLEGGRKLHDFVMTKGGKCANMLDEDQKRDFLKEDDRSRSGSHRLDRRMTYGSILHGEGSRGFLPNTA